MLGKGRAEVRTLFDQWDSQGTAKQDPHRQIPLDFGKLNHNAPADPAVAGGAVCIALDRAMADPAVGVGILLLTTQPQQERVVLATLAVAARSSKPLLFVQGAGNHGDPARNALRAAGHGYFDSPHDALKVAGALSKRVAPEPATAPLAGIELPTGSPAGYLTEPDARRLLESAGIPTTRWQLAADADAAVAAARALACPVAIKAVSGRIVHKSDIGAVRLNVAGDHAVRAACDGIRDAARAAGVDRLDGYLVTEMWKADTELILGVQHDPDFGPMVMVGAGGVLVELMNDVQLAPAPLSHAGALAMLGALAVASQGRLRELDINPLFVAGDRIVAADARAMLA